MSVNAAPNPSNSTSGTGAPSDGGTPPPPPPSSEAPPKTGGSGEEELGKYFDEALKDAQKSTDSTNKATEEMLRQQSSKNARMVAEMGRDQAHQKLNLSQNDQRQATMEQAARTAKDQQVQDASRTEYQDRSEEGEADRQRADRDLAKLEGGKHQQSKQAANKNTAAQLAALKKQSGESNEAHQKRLMAQAEPGEGEVDQAFNKLPAHAKQAIKSQTQMRQVKLLLKFQLQMQKLMQLKKMATQAGDLQLFNQIQKAIKSLQAEKPEIPSELNAKDIEEATQPDETEGTEESEEGEDASGLKSESGDGLRADQQVDTVREQGDGQQQGSGEESSTNGGEVIPAHVMASNVGGLETYKKDTVSVINTGGAEQTQESAELRMAHGALEQMGDGILFYASEGQEGFKRVAARRGQRGHSLDPVALSYGSEEEDESGLKLAHVDHGSSMHVSTRGGKVLNVDQLARLGSQYLSENPDADHIRIGGESVSRESYEEATRVAGIRRNMFAHATHLNMNNFHATGGYSARAMA